MLTDDDKFKILDWFFKRTPNAECPTCHTPFFSGERTANVALNDYMVGLQDISIEDQRIVAEDKGKAFICLVCLNCKFVMMFDAIDMGLNYQLR
ncbi:MAG TPA: hypothetical protein VJL54_02070 [Nitrososphaera sp.]|jgi:hypothetical protein|nr:hypothetical protein [Nitrososphaera sp.]